MRNNFYKTLVGATQLLGPWFFKLVAGGIATGYFLFYARRRRIGRYFYEALMPGKSALYYHACTWRQFLNFTTVFYDRLIVRQAKEMKYDIEGRHHVVSTHKSGGGILLMSHMGSWEIAAHLLTRVIPDIDLMLYMGVKQQEKIEDLQKQSIRRDGIRVVGVGEDGGSPLDIVQSLHFLRRGGIVSMAGDMVWRDDQRTVSGSFLGHRVDLPQAPFVLALSSGTPLIVFFAFRTHTGRYSFKAMPPIFVKAPTRRDRQRAIDEAAQKYLDYMEAALRRHPFEWYHFEAFLKREHIS